MSSTLVTSHKIFQRGFGDSVSKISCDVTGLKDVTLHVESCKITGFTPANQQDVGSNPCVSSLIEPMG